MLQTHSYNTGIRNQDLMYKIFPLLVLFTAALGADVPVLLQPTNSSESFQFENDLYLPIAVHQDTIVTWSESAKVPSYVYAVFKESNGQYFNVAEVPVTGYVVSSFNNGKWLGGQITTNTVTLFQLDADNNPVNQTSLDTGSYGALLSDNTFVSASPSGFTSFVYTEDNSTWSEQPIVDFDSCLLVAFPDTSVWIGDNSIICTNGTYYTHIFTRQADKSWMQTDSFQFNVSLSTIDVDSRFNLYSNDQDTVVFTFVYGSAPGSSVTGYLVIYTKVNGTWVPQVITGEDLGFSTASDTYLGARSFAIIDQDTLLFGAPYALAAKSLKRGGPAITQPTGQAVVIKRHNNVWIPVMRISSPEVALLGVAVGASPDNIIVTVGIRDNSFTIRFYTVPRSSIPDLTPIAAPIAAPIVPPSDSPEAVVPSASTPTKTPVTKVVSEASKPVGYTLSALLVLCLCSLL